MQAVLFLSIVLIVFFALRFIVNAIIKAREPRQDIATSQTITSQPMVRCAHCGVHLPQSEAYFDGQHTYCSEGHLRLGPTSSGSSASVQDNADGD